LSISDPFLDASVLSFSSNHLSASCHCACGSHFGLFSLFSLEGKLNFSPNPFFFPGFFLMFFNGGSENDFSIGGNETLLF
jgi:hypothetical protein